MAANIAMGTAAATGIGLMGIAATTSAYDTARRLPDGGTSTVEGMRLGGTALTGLVLAGGGIATTMAGSGTPMRLAGAAAAVVGVGTLGGVFVAMS